jgi:parvulin-like peptidyl-prolyl isomerase
VRPDTAEKRTVSLKPVAAGLMTAVLPLEPAPASSSLSPATSARATAPGPTGPRRDPQVVLTSAQQPKNTPSAKKRRSVEPTGRPFARVGDEIITYHDLIVATRENLEKVPELMQAYRDPGERNEVRNHINRMGMETLQNLIDRTLLVQEAKHAVKDPKMLERIYEEADKIFHDNEILPLQRRLNKDNEQQVNEAMTEKGRSLEAMRQSFRQYFLAESYLHEKLKDHLKVELPDLLKYYNERVVKHDFDRPAQITWRELLVEAAKCPSRADAERKAEGLLEKLRRGEDFATLAKAQSDGLSSSRKEGGLMHTSPGGYGVKAVNSAIESMPIGQLSGVIPGSDCFHIVKVESRRPAGVASFEEVQDQLRPILVNKKYQDERAKYLAKLRKKTLITIYDLEKTNQRRDQSKTRAGGSMAIAQDMK